MDTQIIRKIKVEVSMIVVSEPKIYPDCQGVDRFINLPHHLQKRPRYFSKRIEVSVNSSGSDLV